MEEERGTEKKMRKEWMENSVEIDMVRDPEYDRMDGTGDIIFCDLCTKDT